MSFTGNSLENHGQIHQIHEIIMQSISVLVSRNPFHLTTSSITLTSLLDIIGKEISGDVFSIERAELLYNISWLSLSSLRSKDIRYFYFRSEYALHLFLCMQVYVCFNSILSSNMVCIVAY